MRLGINTLFMVPGDVGGTETYLRETLLASLVEFPHVEFILFTNNENDGLFRELCDRYSNVHFICLGFNAANRPLRIILEQVKLPIVARKHSLDLLWSPGYTAPFFAPCPQVVTICDLQYKSYPEDMSRIERITLDYLVRGACKRCAAILAISEFSRQEVIAYKFAPPEKVHTVLLGVDPTFGAPIDEGDKRMALEAMLPNGKPYILCVAHTYPHKKVHVLIEAFAQVMDEIPHNLVIVGRERRGEAQIEKAMAQIPDRSRLIRFKDGLPYNSLQILYQAADIFILPSAYEGFGLPVVEAMVAGVPVITSNEGALEEVAGNRAFSIAKIKSDVLAQQILTVVALERKERTERIDAAKQWAETFTWQKSAKTMFEVFHLMLHPQGTKSERSAEK